MGSSIEQARTAFDAGEWAGAYEAFHAADPSELTASDLEAQADAAWWLSKVAESLELRHKAYATADAGGDEAHAAAFAARIAVEHFVRDEASVGAGFLMRAHRHAESLEPDAVEHGWLAMVDSVVARETGEPDRAVEAADRAIDLGRRHGDRDLLAMAVLAKGLALIAAGRPRQGVGLLDEAMTAVLAGDVTPYFTGVIYCAVVAMCLDIGDIGRAGEWSDAARVWCEGLPPDSPFPGMCRVNRAEVSALRGAWAEAQAEAELASRQLMSVDPGLAGWALAQIGDIRRRLGDVAGAERAFEQAQELGADPQPGLALVRLAQRKVDAARTALRLALSDQPHALRRARLLSAQVEAALAAGTLDEARAAASELGEMAGDLDLPAFAAVAATAEGSIALASDQADAAVAALRRASSGWLELRLPYEAARARMLLGRALRACGDEDAARVELRAALGTFERLGAATDAAAATALLEGPDTLPGGLTAREAEVLRLVAAGKTNRDIAVELVISEHTVARHLQNMFAKLGVSTRAAATAYAFEHDLA